MTFTEAAVEVLRLVGKPLHYKKITELAIERNLLSHVGKTPEVTMSSRLATMVKRDRGEVPIIKVKPGVFGLREFTEEQLADLSSDIVELPEVEVENEEPGVESRAGSEGESAVAKAVPEPRKPLPGADVFPEEEDDDEPILGGSDEEDEEDEDDEDASERGEAAPSGETRSARRRRKRRRRGRNDANGEAAEEAPEPVMREAREERRHERRHERHERRHERRDRRGEREREELYMDSHREPADGDLLGKDLADAVASVLSQAGSRGLAVYRVADTLVHRGRLSGDPQALAPTVMAAVRADIARKKVERARPRFRIDGTSLQLTEFSLPQDVVRAEQEVQRVAERQRERTRRAYLRSLGELSNAGLAELVATWLNAEGVVGLRAVRRPGAASGELHLAGTLRRGVEEIRLAVVVYRDLRELGRDRVIEARGALHYYGNASMAWLISLGSVLPGAREESLAPASAPVTLFDGMALASAMERVGVGLSVQYVSVSAIDTELLETLRGPRGEVERERPERGRDRERHRERGGRPEPLPRPVFEDEEEEGYDEELLEEEFAVEAAGDEGAEAGLESRVSEPPAETREAAEVEAREGTRRKRRRRRRRGGRDREAEVATAAAEGAEETGETAEWDEAEESAELDEERREEALDDEAERSVYRDEDLESPSEEEELAAGEVEEFAAHEEGPEEQADESSEAALHEVSAREPDVEAEVGEPEPSDERDAEVDPGAYDRQG